jgi:polar amino acid transport system substrate-binding protein
MRTRSPGIGFLTLSAVLAVIIAACSSSSSSNSSSSAVGTTANRSAPFFKDLPPSIQKAGVLTVGTSVAFPPYDYNPAGSNSDIGFEPDLDKAMTALLGVKLQLVVVGFPELIPGVQDKRFDVAIDGIGDSRARQKVVSFVDYANVGQVILTPTAKAGGVTNLLDICGHTLAYAAGTFGQQIANDVTTLCARAHKPAPSLTAFPDAPSIQLALESGRISYELEDTPTAGYDAKVSKGRISAIAVPSSQATGDFASAVEGVVVPKDQPQLATAIQDALTRMLQDGTYMSILEKWGVQGLAVKKITYDTPSF